MRALIAALSFLVATTLSGRSDERFYVTVDLGTTGCASSTEIEIWHPNRDTASQVPVLVPYTDGLSLGKLGHGTVIRARCGDTLFSLPYRIEDRSPRQIPFELYEVGSVRLNVMQPGPEPVRDRVVRLHSEMAGLKTQSIYTTDQQGSVLIDRLPFGVTYRFEIEEGGHKTQVSFRVLPAERSSVELAVPTLHHIQGVVISRSGPPKEPVQVVASLLNKAGNVISEEEATTLLDGSFSISVYQPGEYAVTTAAPGYHIIHPVKVTVELGEAIATCRLALRPSPKVAGIIVNENDQPVGDALLMIVADPRSEVDDSSSSPQLHWARSDTDGRFEFNRVHPRREYLLTAFPSGEAETTSVSLRNIRGSGPALKVIAPSLVRVATGLIDCTSISQGENEKPWRLDIEKVGQGGILRTALTDTVIRDDGEFEIMSRVGDPDGITIGDEFVLILRDSDWNIRASQSFRHPQSKPIALACSKLSPQALRVVIGDTPDNDQRGGGQLAVYRHMYSAGSFGWEPSDVGFIDTYAATDGRVEISLSPVDSYWLVAETPQGGVAVHYLSREALLSQDLIRMTPKTTSSTAIRVHHAPHFARDDRPVEAILYRIKDGKPVNGDAMSSLDRVFTFKDIRPGVYSLEMAVGGDPRFGIPYNSKVDYCERRRVVVEDSGDVEVYMSQRP